MIDVHELRSVKRNAAQFCQCGYQPLFTHEQETGTTPATQVSIWYQTTTSSWISELLTIGLAVALYYTARGVALSERGVHGRVHEMGGY